MILRRISPRERRKVRPTSNSRACTPITAPMVLISTGHSAGRMITINSICSEKPNSSSATGAKAMPGIGRSTSIEARQ